MDFLVELLVSIFFELPFDVTMESRRVKPWVKTCLFLLLGIALSVLFMLMTINVWTDRHDLPGTIIMAVITIGWTIFVVYGAVSGHKRGWIRK